MNFINVLALFVYFSSAVLVIVDGQSTTDDDDTDKYENNKLIDIVTELRAELRAEQVKSRAEQVKSRAEQVKSRAEQVKLANAIADLKSQLKNKGKPNVGKTKCCTIALLFRRLAKNYLLTCYLLLSGEEFSTN